MQTPPKRPRRLLEALAHKVRHLRLERSYTLQEAAQLAGFSRRFLVEIEGARANPSIGKLSQLSMAFDIPLRELCDLQACSIPEKRIALLGMRGAGKTTIGNLLANELNIGFFELSNLVATQAGLTVAEVFELQGSEGYKRAESEALDKWLNQNDDSILAVPGCVVSASNTYDHVLGNCHTVWLHALPEDYIQRVRKQNGTGIGGAEEATISRVKNFIDQREEEYARAEHQVDTSGLSPEKCCKKIIDLLKHP